MKRFHALFLLLFPTALMAQDTKIHVKDFNLNGVIKEVKDEYYDINDAEAEDTYEMTGGAIYKFNSSGYISSKKTWSGEVVYDDILYKSDQKGRPIKGVNSSSNLRPWEFPITYIVFDDDKNEINFFGSKEEKDSTLMVTKRYNHLKRLIGSTIWSWEDEKHIHRKISYDKIGRVVEKVISEGDAVINKYVYEYIGRLKFREIVFDGNSDRSIKNLMENNVQGDLIKMSREGEEDKITERWHYEYDHMGNWIIMKSTRGNVFKTMVKRTITYY